jgi:recombinational DNA repair ATPase RecF
VRLLELEIRNVRGICHLRLRPDGNNMVIWGPNGSGKSAVVDALDFLLTGRVSRLTGKGTAGIDLGRHGPHVDRKPEEALVRAVLRLPQLETPIEIKRCMAHPHTLRCDKSALRHLEPVLALARRGQHVLTRREILKYVTAEASTRAQEIQALLNISEVESIRKALVRVRNECDKEFQAARGRVGAAEAQLAVTAGQATFQPDTVLDAANHQRAALGGPPLAVLDSAQLKRDLKAGTFAAGARGELVLLEAELTALRGATGEESRARLAAQDGQLRAWLAKIRSDPDLAHALAHRSLTEMGLALLDDSGACPLCGTAWPAGELETYLGARLSAAEAAAHYQERISSLSALMVTAVSSATMSLQKIIAAVRREEAPQGDLAVLEDWVRLLQDLASDLDVPLERYPDARFPAERVDRLLAPAGLPPVLNRMEALMESRHPRSSPQQAAWDTLTRLEENLKTLEAAQSDLERARVRQQRATLFLDTFQRVRDWVLGELYDEVSERFVSLYRALHGDDETSFSAQLEPQGAGLNFEVDFHGRGAHPPHALHSEGHQDSMGLCLYLALAEQLSERFIDLVVLDDVVMSVDAEHRRELCHLLATSFPDRQFLITTHDTTWANQLKHAGVVDARGRVELYNWSLETGPQVAYGVDMWERIDEAMHTHDIPRAAAILRRGSEEYLGLLCDALEAPVKYKLTGRWELGDFLPAAMAQYRKLLKQAKKAAQSWGDRDRLDALNELDSTASQVFGRLNAEQWAVNANVHYNAWANFSEADFRPVVEAFQDLYNLFICSQCGGMLRLVHMAGKPAAVRCTCGKVNWNLAANDKR